MLFSSAKQKNRSDCTGLVLPGGGARGAYQVGVIKAISEFCEDEKSPFQVVTGVSVGSINAASVASHASEFKTGTARMEAMWRNLHTHDIYRTDAAAVITNFFKWAGAILFGMGGESHISIFDNTPLEKLLEKRIHYDKIDKAIEDGDLRALAVTASGLTSGYAITFFQGQEELVEWERARRVGLASEIKTKHLLASAALPIIFKAQRIGSEFFCDGSVRLTAPLSPPIRLGAERVLVIGARDLSPNELPQRESEAHYPSIGEIGGYMMDVVFSDNLDSDIERMSRINHTLSHLSNRQRAQNPLREIDIHTIYPSEDLRDIAQKHARQFPRSIRALLRGLGAWGGDWRLPSYLLFEPGFIGEVIDLGYNDAMAQKDTLIQFLKLREDNTAAEA